MAVYRIFPEKDAFILSDYPSQNTGRDEVLEVSNINGINQLSSAAGDLPAARRSLVQFKTTDISDVIINKISGSAFQSNLNLYLAYAENAPLNYTIEAWPISSSWNMGTGKVSDSPNTTDGVSWSWRSESGSAAWATGGEIGILTNLAQHKIIYIQIIKIFQWTLLTWLNYGIVAQLIIMGSYLN